MTENDLTFEEMERRCGVSNATIHRLISGQQGTSLATLETVMKKLKVNLADVVANAVSELTTDDIKRVAALRISNR